jgi:hypothetical protein
MADAVTTVAERGPGPTNPSQTTKHRSNTPPPVPRFPVPFEVIGNVYVLHHGVTTEITQL